MIKRNGKRERETLFDMSGASSVTDFTGLIPSAPQNDYSIEAYNNIMDIMADASAMKLAGAEAKKDIEEST